MSAGGAGLPAALPARAFVLGGQGAGKSTLARLCRAHRRVDDRPGLSPPLSAHLVDPLHGSWAIELAFFEVPAWWTLEDFRRSAPAGPADCALLVVDVGSQASFDAACERACWAKAVGIRCISVLSVGLCVRGGQEVLLEDLEGLASQVSFVQPAYFDVGVGACQALQLSLFLDTLAVRLAWLCWEEGASAERPANGAAADAPHDAHGASRRSLRAAGAGCAASAAQEAAGGPGAPRRSRASPARHAGGDGAGGAFLAGTASAPALVAAGEGARGRQASAPQRARTPDSPAARAAPRTPRRTPRGEGRPAAAALPAAAAPRRGSRGDPGAPAAPGRAAARAAAAQALGEERAAFALARQATGCDLRAATGAGGTPAPVHHRPRDGEQPAPRPAPVRETVVSLAALERGGAAPAPGGAGPAGAAGAPCRRGALQFDMDLHIGGGCVAPIEVYEHSDLEALAADIASDHSLGEVDQRRIAAHLERLRREVTSGQPPGAPPAGAPGGPAGQAAIGVWAA